MLTALAAPGSSETPARRPTTTFSVRDFGASGDGITFDTSAVQAAIDACAATGGGEVRFPAGRYLSGGLFLKSHITLHLEAGATLLGSAHLEDYPVKIPALRSYTDNYTERALIYGEDLTDIGIEGRGMIDGQGATFPSTISGSFKAAYKLRPYLVRFVSCRNVSVRGITFKDSPMWVQHYLACTGLLIDGIRVTSTCNISNDGIDIDSCDQVRIANCDIRSGDDSIVLKSTLERPCRNVVVTNCVLSSDCNAFKLGTESIGGFENIAMSNCVISNTRWSGIALELVDGGKLERVNISNVIMDNVSNPIFIRLGNRGRVSKPGIPPPGIGQLGQVRIANIQAVGADEFGCSITGLPDHPVEDIALENISIQFRGGGTINDSYREIPENPGQYPEYNMFGRLPAYGFYFRHVRGAQLSRVQIGLAKPDARPALLCQDVVGLQLSGLRASASSEAAPTVVLNETLDAFIHGCQALADTGTYLRIEGKNSREIRLVGNNFRKAAQAIAFGPGVAAEVVSIAKEPSSFE